MRKYAKAVISYFSDISCEPIVVLFNLGYGIKYGAGVLDQLYLEKACRYELQGGQGDPTGFYTCNTGLHAYNDTFGTRESVTVTECHSIW